MSDVRPLKSARLVYLSSLSSTFYLSICTFGVILFNGAKFTIVLPKLNLFFSFTCTSANEFCRFAVEQHNCSERTETRRRLAVSRNRIGEKEWMKKMTPSRKNGTFFL